MINFHPLVSTMTPKYIHVGVHMITAKTTRRTLQVFFTKRIGNVVMWVRAVRMTAPRNP
jgi:hypothetical protein